MDKTKLDEFLKRCWVNKLRLNVIAETPWHIEVHGDNFTAAKAREYLDKHRDLEAEVILKLADDNTMATVYCCYDDLMRCEGRVNLLELIHERAAIREADNLTGGTHAAIVAEMNRGY